MDKNYFLNMVPAKYYDCADLKHQNAQRMIRNYNSLYYATIKKDGEWSRAIIDDDGNVTMQSRTLSKVTGTYGDKTEHVPHIVEQLKEFFPKGTVLIGELCFLENKYTSKDVGSVLRCLPPKAIQRQKDKKLYYYIFDCLCYNGKNLMSTPYSERIKVLEDLISNGVNIGENISIPAIFKNQDFALLIQYVINNGGEGVVICKKTYKYEPGKRKAWETLKVKKKINSLDLKVVDVLPPTKIYEGNNEDWCFVKNGERVTKYYYYGWAGSIVVELSGNKVRVSSGLSDDDRQYLTTPEAKELIKNGKLYAEVSAMEVTEDGSLRHPTLTRLRTDI